MDLAAAARQHVALQSTSHHRAMVGVGLAMTLRIASIH